MNGCLIFQFLHILKREELKDFIYFQGDSLRPICTKYEGQMIEIRRLPKEDGRETVVL